MSVVFSFSLLHVSAAVTKPSQVGFVLVLHGFPRRAYQRWSFWVKREVFPDRPADRLFLCAFLRSVWDGPPLILANTE